MINNLKIGIVGAGSFAAFAAAAFLKIDGVSINAVSDINTTSGEQLAQELNTVFYSYYELMLADADIDLVYIATPPHLHFSLSKKALNKGKHVICEKPAALLTAEAEELRALANKNGLLYVVNLMQRYNPMYKTVKTLIDTNVLGKFLHGFFENYASDENLSEQHWFWDEEQSGGIFIEHAVHFFDTFSGWLGEGKVLNALQIRRKNTKTVMYDRVQATVLYEDGIVNFYHGFDQPIMLDRQELRLEFERGDITLYGWIPVRLRLHGLLTKEELSGINKLLGTSSVTHHHHADKQLKGRFADVVFDEHVTIESGNDSDKQHRYQQMLSAMLQDQWQWIKDRNYIRLINDDNAVESTRMGEEAKNKAQKY